MSWVQQVPGTPELTSSIVNVWCTLLTHPMTLWVHISLHIFWSLWFHLHLLGITLFISFSSTFSPCLCPPSCLPPYFWTVVFLHLSAGLGYDVGGLFSSSFPPCYSYCLCPSCYLVLFGLRLTMKMEAPMIFWFLPWIFVETSSPSETALPGFH